MEQIINKFDIPILIKKFFNYDLLADYNNEYNK